MVCENCDFVISSNGFISIRFLVKENGIYYVVCPNCGEKNYYADLQNLGNAAPKKAAKG